MSQSLAPAGGGTPASPAHPGTKRMPGKQQSDRCDDRASDDRRGGSSGLLPRVYTRFTPGIPVVVHFPYLEQICNYLE